MSTPPQKSGSPTHGSARGSIRSLRRPSSITRFCQDRIITDAATDDDLTTVRAVDDDDDLGLPGGEDGEGTKGSLVDGEEESQLEGEGEGDEPDDMNVNVVGASDEARARVIPDREYPYLSPLAVAVFARQLEVVSVLLRFEADPTRKDGSSLSPYQRCLLQVGGRA
jgi:hypothetical protein